MASNGFRTVAHDRRGHGRSSQPWDGNTMDDYRTTSLPSSTPWTCMTSCWSGTDGWWRSRAVRRPPRRDAHRQAGARRGHPTADAAEPGEPGRYAHRRLRRHAGQGAARPVTALRRPGRALLRREPAGIRRVARRPRPVLADRHARSAQAAHDCIRQFSETDFHDDLEKINVPTLIIHGDDDQIVPIDASARLAAQDRPWRQARSCTQEGHTNSSPRTPSSSTPTSSSSSNAEPRRPRPHDADVADVADVATSIVSTTLRREDRSPMIYGSIVKRGIRQSFDHVNHHRWDVLIELHRTNRPPPLPRHAHDRG